MTWPSSGAQTERRGEAGPVRILLGGEDSPAAFVQPIERAQGRGAAALSGGRAARCRSASTSFQKCCQWERSRGGAPSCYLVTCFRGGHGGFLAFGEKSSMSTGFFSAEDRCIPG